jgi:hypothetical protein
MQLLVRDMDDLMFGANEMSICKQDLILQEELNCETSISVRAKLHLKNIKNLSFMEIFKVIY